MIATLRERYAITVKGAPDMVLDLCRYHLRMDDRVIAMDEAPAHGDPGGQRLA